MTDIPAPVTSYRRAEQNRRNSRWLIGLFVLLLIPPLLFLTGYLGAIVVMFLLSSFQDMGELAAIWMLISVVLLVAFVANVFRTRKVIPESLGATPMQGEQGAVVVRRLENLSLAAGIETPALYFMRSPQPNALAAGQPGGRAAVVLTEGLLRTVDKRGLDGILAHELAHILNEDTRIDSTLAAVIRSTRLPTPIYWLFVFGVLSVFNFALTDPEFMHEMQGSWHEMIQGEFATAGSGLEWVPRWMFVALLIINTLGYLEVVVWPPLAKFLQSRVSRQREFLADAEAVTLTRDPLGLALALDSVSTWSAMKQGPVSQLADSRSVVSGRKDISRIRGISHLCLVPNRHSIFGSLFPTHPAPADRVEAIRRMSPVDIETKSRTAPDAELVAAADAMLSAKVMPATQSQSSRARSLAVGFAAGALVESAIVFLAGNVSPVGVGGAIAAYVANRMVGRRDSWPAIAMFLLAGPPSAVLFPPFGSVLIEPLAGAALGAMSREALSALRDRLTAGWRGGGS